MKYDLTAAGILKRLGFDQPVGRETLEAFQQTHSLPLPKVYREFMELALDCPILATSDLWSGRMNPFEMEPRRLYSRLSEEEKAQVCDYLEIGSDYGAGIVTFGLRVEDLSQDDPPVYLQHEADPVTQWKPAYPALSAFLQEVVLSALALVNYETAEEELEELGWEYHDHFMEYFEGIGEDEDAEEEEAEATLDTLRAKGIDPEQVQWCSCTCGGRVFCCYDEEADVFYAGQWDWEEENTLYTISRIDRDGEEDA